VGRLAEAWIGTPAAAAKASIFGYDSMGRTVMNNQCTPANCGVGNFPLSYSYDLLGNMTSHTTGVGITFTQTFDSAGRVTQLTSSFPDAQHPGTLATVDSSAGYYATGAMRKVTFGNGLTETAAFNKRLQPCRTNVNSSGSILTLCNDAVPGGNVQDFSYGYNLGTADNGNVTSMTAVGSQVFNRSYTYDSLNRLLTLSAPGDACSGLSWTYDAWANRTDQTVTGGACNNLHQPVNTNNRVSGTGYQYDAAGNMTNDGSHSYTYDAENRIIAVDGGATASYIYDALGRRVRKTTGSTWTDYVYDLAGNVVYEFTSTQGACFAPCPAAGYIYMGGRLGAEYKEGTTYFFHQDHLGSTRLMTKLDQTLRDSMDFLPYGEQIAGDTSTSHKFTGKERDQESGLDYFGARYYSNGLGRFISADWSAKATAVPYANFGNPQSLNLYAYVGNNPLTRIDKDGHCWSWLQGACNFVEKAYHGVFTDYGFKTNAQVGQVNEQNRQWLIQNHVVTPDKNGNSIDWNKASASQVRTTYGAVVTAMIIRLIHSPATISGAAMNSVRAMSTEEIIYSLKYGEQPGIIKPDGTVMNGNTRLAVLQERGVDINKLGLKPDPMYEEFNATTEAAVERGMLEEGVALEGAIGSTKSDPEEPPL
jgi:RHS repeat-associated protein